MHVKPVDPNAIIRDPVTKLPLPAEGADRPDNVHWNRRWMYGEVWKREGDAWVRRLPSGELERVAADAPVPTGSEPVAPLTTRTVARK